MTLQILDTGIFAPEGIFQYAWFRLREAGQAERYQIVALRELAEIIASVGLAQNLAALRALAAEGIQRGTWSSMPGRWPSLQVPRGI
jgi:hypothetical protein